MRMRTIEEELNEPDWFDDVSMQLMEEDCTPAIWFIAMKAFESAAIKSGDPAQFSCVDANYEAELNSIKAEAKAMTDAMGAE